MTKKTQIDADTSGSDRQTLKMPAFPMGIKVITKVIIAIKVTPKIKEFNFGHPWCVGKTPEAEVLILPSQLT